VNKVVFEFIQGSDVTQTAVGWCVSYVSERSRSNFKVKTIVQASFIS